MPRPERAALAQVLVRVARPGVGRLERQADRVGRPRRDERRRRRASTRTRRSGSRRSRTGARPCRLSPPATRRAKLVYARDRERRVGRLERERAAARQAVVELLGADRDGRVGAPQVREREAPERRVAVVDAVAAVREALVDVAGEARKPQPRRAGRGRVVQHVRVAGEVVGAVLEAQVVRLEARAGRAERERASPVRAAAGLGDARLGAVALERARARGRGRGSRRRSAGSSAAARVAGA